MNLQSQEANAALALYPVYPPQWITPVQPAGLADGGIALSAFGSQGLMLVIDPITGLRTWTMAAFDTVTLYVNGVDTGVKETILPGKEGDRFAVYVPQRWFTNGVNAVHYKVTRVSGNEEDSLTLKLLYHNPAPTITVSHPASIGPGQPAVITFTRGYPRAYDTVTLTIGTWSIRLTHPDHTKPLTYTLTAADLQQIGDGTRSVSAVVVDQLTNSGVSATTSIAISANRLDLQPPTVERASGNNYTPSNQDIIGLVPKGSLLPTDKISFVWQAAPGVAVDGSFTSLQQLVSAGLRFVIPHSVLAYSLRKQVTVTYVVERNGVIWTSLPLLLNILPLPANALNPPKILEADANNVLDVTLLGD
ncbi:hypothetical protein ACXR0M_27195, partial [Pseudomonas sp. Eth.TT006]